MNCFCGKELAGEQKKFCSRSCAAQFNNSRRSPESREKQRISVTATTKRDPYTRIYQNECSNCSKKFFYKTTRVTCSRKCELERKIISGSIGGKKSFALQLRRSKDEISLYDKCKVHFKSVEPNYIISRGWDTDIALLDHKIAVFWNGPWHYQTMGNFYTERDLENTKKRDHMKTRIFTDLGWKVIVFEDRDYSPDQALEYLIGATAKI